MAGQHISILGETKYMAARPHSARVKAIFTLNMATSSIGQLYCSTVSACKQHTCRNTGYSQNKNFILYSLIPA